MAKTGKQPREKQFARVLSEAEAAGLRAGMAISPTPMQVYDGHGGVYRVEDGMCGFAGVILKPASHPFVRWLKASGHGFGHYPSGFNFTVRGHNQSYERKVADARARLDVVKRHFPELSAFVWSQLD